MIYANEAKITLILDKSMSTGTVFTAEYFFRGDLLDLTSAGYVRQRNSMTKLGNTVTIWYVIATLNAKGSSVVGTV